MKLKTLHQWKKPEEKEEIFYDSIYTEYPEKANLYTEKKLVVSWNWGYEDMNKFWSQQIRKDILGVS